MQKRDILFLMLGFFAVIFVLLFLIRTISQKEIDDVHPAIPCEQRYLEESDILWIIPLYNNVSIAQNKTWCASISSLNKTIGMHGVYHKYEEFSATRDKDYLDIGIDAFKQCFGHKPSVFKAPQLVLSEENKAFLKEQNLTIHGKIGQMMHKVYHCNDTGRFTNKFIRIF